MPINRDHYTNVLKYWRSIETFTLPDIPFRRRDDNKLFAELKQGDELPWESGKLAVPKEGQQWRHTLYFHIVFKEDVVDLLARLSGSKEYREFAGGFTCLSALVVDQSGQPAERTYSPAAFIYGIKILREKLSMEQLPELLKQAQEDYLSRFQIAKAAPPEEDKQESGEEKKQEGNTVNWALLTKELKALAGLTRNALTIRKAILCVSEIVASTANPEAPFLNSYYVEDLNHLLHHPGDIGGPLETYLREDVDLSTRYNVLRQGPLLDGLHPKYQSPGRWPSSPSYGLYTAQQAALHLAMSTLRKGPGLVGINGPPGTGKTTLLREVIADVVVARAKRLLKGDVTKLFKGQRIALDQKMGYYRIDRSLFGNDGIVVTSNNNTAIENISKELPVLKSIDRESFRDETYFHEMASSIQGEPCWGMLSAVLGKSVNRNAFVSKFWFNNNGFGKFLREQYEDPIQKRKNEESYAATAGELKSLLEEYEVFQQLAGAYHELLSDGSRPQELQVLGKRLQEEYGLSSANLPGPGWPERSLDEIHRLTPYSSGKVNLLRSRIFLRSLELHEWAIRVNARYFSINLNAFINILSSRPVDTVNEEIAATLWNSFFFCIPLVSVTLASFQRQFSKLRRASIGWLLLDEAGQATPASACGAIWRSQRCIVIGDTMQIPPVVTIAPALDKLLQDAYGIKDDGWSPISQSAQSLADRVTDAGAIIHLSDGVEAWTGIPLRAHRRCGEPMFSISNTIAYNGQMVNVGQDEGREIPTGGSGWIDVRAISALKGHAIAEELQVLKDLLLQLASYKGKIFVISPFRTVAEICKTAFQEKDRIECGTIHTFQGKEAEIVFLVLGTMPASRAARDWVAGSPNILNVAITRARQRLYVIGDRQLWADHPYFSYLAEKLPLKQHVSGRLF